jgi:energy-coupling factor transport system permease protein
MVAFSTQNPFYLLLLVAVSWFVYSACRREGAAGRTFRTFAIFALVTLVVRTSLVLLDDVTLANFAFAFLEGARLATLLIVFGTFNSVTDPFGVLRLAPRRLYEPALAAALALSIAPRTMEAAGRVREAQELRGITLKRWRSLPALAVPVLESGMEDAMTLAESMDSRGHGRGRRTRYRPEPWTVVAVVVAVLAVVAMLAFLTAGLEGWGGLFPPTDPPRWPEVSIPLAAAVLLLAAPAVLAGRAPP